MKKLKITGANPGNYQEENQIFEYLKLLDEGQIEITEDDFTITTIMGKLFASKIQKGEASFFNTTYYGTYDNGIRFRLVKPGSETMRIRELKGEKAGRVTFGSMKKDGYAVHFDILEE